MARFVPVSGHAAVAHLLARPPTPVLSALSPQNMEVFRCVSFDARLLVNIPGNLRPAGMLRSVKGRMRTIVATPPC